MDTPAGHFELLPLRPRPEPAVPVEQLVSINQVSLAAADVPCAMLRQFYTDLLGLTFLGEDEGVVRFTHHQRRVCLYRSQTVPLHCALLIRSFGDAIVKLRGRNIPHEILHSDAGLSRTAIVRDPAGNWIHLLETRPF